MSYSDKEYSLQQNKICHLYVVQNSIRLINGVVFVLLFTFFFISITLKTFHSCWVLLLLIKMSQKKSETNILKAEGEKKCAFGGYFVVMVTF